MVHLVSWRVLFCAMRRHAEIVLAHLVGISLLDFGLFYMEFESCHVAGGPGHLQYNSLYLRIGDHIVTMYE